MNTQVMPSGDAARFRVSSVPSGSPPATGQALPRMGCRGLLVVLVLLLTASQASARVLWVWKESPAPAYPYPDKTHGAHTVQAALSVAASGDTVFVLGDSQKDPGGRCVYQENLQVPRGVELLGDSQTVPILDGGQVGPVVMGIGNGGTGGPETRVASFEIRNGKTALHGAGLYFMNTPVRIDHNCIHHNEARIGGGIGLYLSGSWLNDERLLPAVRIEDNLIESNHADWRGGGVSVEVASANPSGPRTWQVEIARNIVRRNVVSAAGGYLWGGGLDVFKARVYAEDNLFEYNYVLMGGASPGPQRLGGEAFGGAVGVFNLDENSFLSSPLEGLSDLARLVPARQVDRLQYFSYRNIYRNNNAAVAGGAIAAVFNAGILLHGDWIGPGNDAQRGGGVYVNTWSAASLFQTHVTENIASLSGGGLYVVDGSLLLLNESKIDLNQAKGANPGSEPIPAGGGGIYLRNAQADLTGPNEIRSNRALAGSGEQGYGGGLLALQVDKRPLLGNPGLITDTEAEVSNQNTRVLMSGPNLFAENTAGKEGGAIAMAMLSHFPFITAGAPATPWTVPPFSFQRSELLDGTQIRNNHAPDDAAGGIYYKEKEGSFLEGGFTYWPEFGLDRHTTAKIRGSLIEKNDGWGIRVVGTGSLVLDEERVGTIAWVRPAMEIHNSVIRNNGGGIHLIRSWPSIIGNQLIGNEGTQILIDNFALPLPVITQNNLDGAGRSVTGIFRRIGRPAPENSPRWGNHFWGNNLVNHSGPAALSLDAPPIQMDGNWWGSGGPVEWGLSGQAPANSVANVVTDPALSQSVAVPAPTFAPIEVTPNHPSPPAEHRCEGTLRPLPLNFRIVPVETIRTVTVGSSTCFSLAIVLTEGTARPVTLTVTGLPPRSTGSFSANPVLPASGTGTLFSLCIAVDALTPPGSYTLTVQGSAETLSRATTITLQVTAETDPPPPDTGR